MLAARQNRDAGGSVSATIRSLWPLLLVSDMTRSLEFYCETLGFEVVGRAGPAGAPFWCRLQRGSACLMLEWRDADALEPLSHGVALYFICDDAELMFEELTSSGLRLEPPSTAYYGMKQLFVPEPDGHEICFESPTDDWVG